MEEVTDIELLEWYEVLLHYMSVWETKVRTALAETRGDQDAAFRIQVLSGEVFCLLVNKIVPVPPGGKMRTLKKEATTTRKKKPKTVLAVLKEIRKELEKMNEKQNKTPAEESALVYLNAIFR